MKAKRGIEHSSLFPFVRRSTATPRHSSMTVITALATKSFLDIVENRVENREAEERR
jgi:hypothetical protein